MSKLNTTFLNEIISKIIFDGNVMGKWLPDIAIVEILVKNFPKLNDVNPHTIDTIIFNRHMRRYLQLSNIFHHPTKNISTEIHTNHRYMIVFGNKSKVVFYYFTTKGERSPTFLTTKEQWIDCYSATHNT